jgi:hypothetical protein
MPTPRYGPAAVTASDGRIFVFGGCDGTKWLKSVEVYLP